MVAGGLLDTGAIVALLDRRDPWHEACVSAIRSMRLPLLTSTAVLTEAFHFIGTDRRGNEELWRFLRSGATMLGALTQADLPAIERLMARYHDRPMDLADATLVHLAERESLTAILTIDNDDFETYRIGARRRFRVLPGRRA